VAVKRRVVILASLAVAGVGGNALAAGSSAGTIQKPEDFMQKVVRLTVSGHNAEAWALLHPAHQKLAPRSRFVRCRTEPAGTTPSRIASAEFQGKRYTRIDTPLIPQHTATAVKLKLLVATGAKRIPAEVTVRAVWTGQRWAWILPVSNIVAFRAGKCPTT
jgi:hypothetical protein